LIFPRLAVLPGFPKIQPPSTIIWRRNTMKKRLLMIIALGLVLVITAMAEGALNPWARIYPTMPSYMTGVWREASNYGPTGGGQFNEWPYPLELSIAANDINGHFYGQLAGLPIDQTVYLSGSINSQKEVTMIMTCPGTGVSLPGSAVIIRFDGKLSGPSGKRKLSGVLTLVVAGEEPFTKAGKILFTESQMAN
jgi:hypothetical protein